MPTRTAALALSSVLLAACLAGAAPKTPVTVKFVLAAYSLFTASEVNVIQKAGADHVVKQLRVAAPFLDYTTAPASFTLTVTLRPRSAAERPQAPGEVVLPGEVVFQFDVSGPRVVNEAVYVPFRPANDIGTIPPVDGFLKEVALKLSLEVLRDRLRPSLLKIPIASTAEVKSNPAGWLLPHERRELCMEVDSELAIEHNVRLTGGGTRSPKVGAVADGDMNGRILGSPTPPTAFRDQLGTFPLNQVSVNRVLVTKFQEIAGCASSSFSK